MKELGTLLWAVTIIWLIILLALVLTPLFQAVLS